MKKLVSVFLVTALAASVLTACSDTETANDTAVPETQAEAVETQAAAEFNPAMTDDLQNLFDAGMEGFVGVDYTPVLFMGVPADNPLGNTFLCTACVVSPDAVPYWALVTMEDVGSEVNITDIKIIDYAAASTDAAVTLTDDNGEALLGGWQATTDVPVPDEVQNIDGHMFYEVLATQVVSGMNYSCICLEDGQWEIVTVYVNTEGAAEVTNIADLSI